MAAKIRNYFAGANSAQGFVNYFEDNIKELDKLYILKGYSDKFKSTLIKNIGINLFIKGCDIEYIHCASDQNLVEAIIVPALKVCIVNGDVEYIADMASYPKIAEIIDMEADASRKASLINKEYVSDVKSKILKYYKQAYKQLKKILKIHNEWDKIYIIGIDFDEIEEIADNAIKKFLSMKAMKKEGIIRNRFSSCITYRGFSDFFQDLTKDLETRCFITGGSKSARNVILGKIANTAHNIGLNTEIYHNVIDPDYVDLVIIPEAELAFFDCSKPYKYMTSGAQDQIIDIDEIFFSFVNKDKYKKQLDSMKSDYKKDVSEGILYLSRAKEEIDKLDIIIDSSVDSSELDRIYSLILSKLNN